MQGESKMFEVIPPWLSVDLSLYLPTYPVGDFWAGPQSAIKHSRGNSLRFSREGGSGLIINQPDLV